MHAEQLNLSSSHTLMAWGRIDGDEAIALVHLPENAVTPYATYRVDRDRNCYLGDYLHTDSTAKAWEAFNNRHAGA